MQRLFVLILSLMSDVALAQTTGTVNPSTAPTQPSVNEDVPPGGCMPIGMTASGEIVFPMQCKEFIEQHRGTAAERKPAVAEDKPAAVEERRGMAADQKPVVVEDQPAAVEEHRGTVAGQKPVVVEDKPAAMEEHQGVAAEKKPVVVENKPVVVEEKASATQPEGEAPEGGKPVNKQVEAVPLPRRAERESRERVTDSGNCTHYRTYDPASGSYRGYDGRRRFCR